MTAEKKKLIKIIFVVVTVVIAGYITYVNFLQDIDSVDSLESGVMFWMKCCNKECQHIFQIDRKDYYRWAQKYPMSPRVPPMICPKCDKVTALKAFKCPKCENLFLAGSAGGDDYEDRCPKCKYSKLEEVRTGKIKK